MSAQNTDKNYTKSAFNLYNLTRVRGMEVAHVLASSLQGGTENPSMNWLVFAHTQERIRLAHAKAATSVVTRKMATVAGCLFLAAGAVTALSAGISLPFARFVGLATGVAAIISSAVYYHDRHEDDVDLVNNQFRKDMPEAIPSAEASGDIMVYRKALKILEKEGLLGHGAFGASGQGSSDGQSDFWTEAARYRSTQTALPVGRESIRLVHGAANPKALEHKAA